MPRKKKEKVEARKTQNEIHAVLNGVRGPVLRQIADALMKRWNGPEGVAEKIDEAYKSSPVGGQARAKLLEMFLNAQDKSAPKDTSDDMSLLTDEDIQREAERLIRKAEANPDA